LNILIVKLSSLGDVVHTMPAVQDIRRALPHAKIDWVVEPGFAPLVARCEGVHRVIPCAIRSWRKHWWRASTRAAWQAFQTDLATVKYDAVIDCQGLTKSALVARCAQLTQKGKRYAMANRSAGSGYEAPTRWLADVALQVPTHVHAVDRARILCAQTLGYPQPADIWHFGLLAQSNVARVAIKTIAFIHGSSRADKCWSEAHWVQLGSQLQAKGYAIALLHGNDEEEQRSARIAKALGGAAPALSSPQATQGGGVQVWPRMLLDALTDRLALCAGAIGVDSGLSHVAVALDLPHVQLYNFDTAWRTGPIDLPRQCSVFAQQGPTVQQVWDAWCQVLARSQTNAPVLLPSAGTTHA
jgi:heptosyltransferase I